jgi:manganese transport protein
VFSQVVLSLQLPFAVYPLVRLPNSKAWMGKYANKPLATAVAWSLTALLVGLNALLMADFF